MPTHDVLLPFLQNVVNGKYTRLHTLVSYVLLVATRLEQIRLTVEKLERPSIHCGQ